MDIAELKRKAEAATPGPWECAHAGVGRKGGGFEITEYFVRRPGDDIAIACDICDPTSENHLISGANADFIATANPSTILKLIAELEAQAARIKELELHIERLSEPMLGRMLRGDFAGGL